MNPRTTALLAVAAAALAAFVYFYEIRGEQGRREAEELTKRLFPDIQPDDVEAIWLTTKDEKAARVERVEGGWRVTEPVDFPGDDVTLEGMASSLAQLTSEGKVPGQQTLAVYGLAEGAQVVGFRAGGADLGLRIGDKTPVGSNSYVATAADDTVYMVPTYRISGLARALVDLRDKSVLDFDRASVVRFSTAWPDGSVSVERRDGTWWITEPIEGAADESTVEDLLSDLAFLRADDFVDDPPPPEETGLDAPEFSVTLQIAPGPEDEGDAPREVTFALGSLHEEGYRLARGGQQALYRVAGNRLDDLPRELVAYRFKELANFDASKARSFEVRFQPTSSGGDPPAVITGEYADSGWKTSPRPMAAGKARRLVSELGLLSGIDIVAEALGESERASLGLEPPLVELHVFGEAGDADSPPLLAHVLLGAADPDQGIVAMSDGSDVVYRLDYALAEHLPLSYEAFENRFVSAEASGAADGEIGETEEIDVLDDVELDVDESP